MIIEFCGLPGSGKTSVSKSLAHAGENFTRVEFINKSQRYFFTVKFILCHPVQFLFWLKLLFEFNDLWQYKLHLLLVSFARQALAESLNKSDNYILIDEGLMQRFFSIIDRPLARQEFLTLLNGCVLPEAITVVLGGDFKRFLTDSNYFKSPRWLKGEDYLKNWITAFENNFQVFCSILENEPKVKLIKIKGSGEGEEVESLSSIKLQLNNI